MARAGDARPRQDASQGGPGQVDAFPISEQLGEVGVVGAGVGGAGQLHHRVGLVIRHGVAWLTAAVPMGKCGGAFPPIGRQKSPGMAFTHPQDLGGLGYR